MRGRTPHVLGAFATAVLLAAVIAPLIALLRAAFPAGATAPPIDDATWRVIGRTSLQALASTLLATAIGLPAAWALARPELPLRRFWRALFLIPFVLPSLVAATAMLAWFGPRGLTGFDLSGTWTIVVLTHAFYNVGVIARVVSAHLEGATPRLLEAAATLGASPWRRTLRVTLPTATPALLSAASLVYLLSFTSFGVILVLAPDPSFATLEVEIYRRLARTFDLPGASALALMQLALVLLIAQPWLRAQRRSTRGIERGSAPLGRLRGAALAAVAPAALTVALPLAALFAVAANPPGEGGAAAAWSSLLTPSGVIGVADARSAAWNSLRFAVGATALALAVGGALAIAGERGAWRWLDTAAVLPWAMSAVTLSLGLLLLYPNLMAGGWGIVVAHALLAVPLVARTISAAFAAVPLAQREAAATLGASPTRVLRRIDLPLTRAAWASAAAFAFAASLGEFGAALVLRRPENATLSVAIAERLGRPGAVSYAEALLLSALLGAMVAIAAVTIDALGRRRARRGARRGTLEP